MPDLLEVTDVAVELGLPAAIAEVPAIMNDVITATADILNLFISFSSLSIETTLYQSIHVI